MTRPYLSAVFVSRNDEHGGNMTRRMQCCFSGFIEQCERTGLDAELLIVEWNPPQDRPLLCEALQWPASTRHCSVRILTVPQEIHRKYPYSDRLPLNIPVAKNLGTRHSEGEFVLQSCVDNLLNNPLADFLAERRLDRNGSYRVDRLDVNRGVMQLKDLPDQLAYCPAHVMHIYQKMDLRLEFPELGRNIPDVPQVHANGSGDFQLFSREVWHRIRGYWENDSIGYGIDVLAACQAYYAGVRELTLGEPCRVYHIDHDVLWRRPDGILAHPWIKFFKTRVIPPTWKPFFRRLVEVLHLRPKSELEKQNIHVVNTDWVSLLVAIHRNERSYAINGEGWGLAGYTPETTFRLTPRQ